MSHPVLDEKLLSFARAARSIQPIREGRPVAPATIWRWATHGARARDGRMVQLQSWKVGGTRCTTVEALVRFFDALNSDADTVPATPATDVDAKLDALGI